MSVTQNRVFGFNLVWMGRFASLSMYSSGVMDVFFV